MVEVSEGAIDGEDIAEVKSVGLYLFQSFSIVSFALGTQPAFQLFLIYFYLAFGSRIIPVI